MRRNRKKGQSGSEPRYQSRKQKKKGGGGNKTWFSAALDRPTFLPRSSRCGAEYLHTMKRPLSRPAQPTSSESLPSSPTADTCDRRLVPVKNQRSHHEYPCPWVVVMISVSFRMPLRLHRPAGTMSRTHPQRNIIVLTQQNIIGHRERGPQFSKR